MRNSTVFSVALVAALGGIFSLTACGGGGGGTSTASGGAAPSGSAIALSQIANNSYANFKSIGLKTQTLPSGDNTVRAYANFAGNGRADLFRAVLTYDVNLPQAQATASRFEFFSQNANGSYTLNTTVMLQTAGCLHPRKAIVADFNRDGKADVFVACHGYDANPFPGERNKVVLSQPNGTYTASDASSDVGFNHGASAMDLNGDGFIDVMVVNNFDPQKAYVLLNDGTGHFTRETTQRVPTAIATGGYFSLELVDINEDGKPDLIMGGHEFDNTPTAIFINPGNNNFSAVAPLVIPAVANEGVVLDFTATGTGATRTLWVLRTSGGDGTFYKSRVLQKVLYPAMTSSVVSNQRPAQWIPWTIAATSNAASVITSDNADDAFSVPQ